MTQKEFLDWLDQFTATHDLVRSQTIRQKMAEIKNARPEPPIPEPEKAERYPVWPGAEKPLRPPKWQEGEDQWGGPIP